MNPTRLMTISLTAALLLFATPVTATQSSPPEASEQPPAAATDADRSNETPQGADEEIAERRKKIVEEAVAATSETRHALSALDDGNADDAIAALERATGKLELLLAREPDLALAPVDVQVSTHDLYTTVEAIEGVRAEAEQLLEDGKVQEARNLLAVLGSEIVVSVVSLPLATYPEAIKATVPLIDEGQLEDAAAALHAALNLQIVTNHVIPLPVVRAEKMLEEAQELASREDRSEDDDRRLSELLADAREQMRLAEALGYGGEDDFADLYAQFESMGDLAAADEKPEGWFGGIASSVGNLRKAIMNN